jgi:hypothetical protein
MPPNSHQELPMKMYPRIWNLLRHKGLSAQYASMCILDAARGDKYAMKWIVAAFQGRR